jgi:hypothetical protein
MKFLHSFELIPSPFTSLLRRQQQTFLYHGIGGSEVSSLPSETTLTPTLLDGPMHLYGGQHPMRAEVPTTGTGSQM